MGKVYPLLSMTRQYTPMGTNIPIIAAIAAKLKHLGARQQVISQNIANADTPGYRAKDLDTPDFGALVDKASGKPMVGRPHVEASARMRALGASAPPPAGIRNRADTFETKPLGNDVILEDELMKLADVQMEYAALTNLYRKQSGLLKLAIGRGG